MARHRGMVPIEQIVAKWQRNSAAAGPSIQAGVMAVTTAPTQLAAQRSQAYLTGVQNAVSSGRWQQGLQRVSLADWQNAMIQKGIPRQAQGVAQAGNKFAAFMQAFMPFVQQAVRALPPRGTLEENLNRANQLARTLHGFRRGAGVAPVMLPGG